MHAKAQRPQGNHAVAPQPVALPQEAHPLDQRSPHLMLPIQRLLLAPQALTTGHVLHLQRTLGNRAVGRLFTSMRTPHATGAQTAATLAQRPPAGPPVQRQEECCPAALSGTPQNLQGVEEVTDAAARPAGLPAILQASVERLSGMTLDHVRVHYQSDRPAQMHALAYTQGADIHVAPGQEKHVPHEAWHVVQQAQGRVQPTIHLPGEVPVNDDQELEQEADAMGARAVQMQASPPTSPPEDRRDVASDSLPTPVWQADSFANGMATALQCQVIQCFESGEHAMIGVGSSTSSYPDGVGDLSLPQGAVVFTGEMVAFGDFYADMKQLLEAPRQEIEALAGMCCIEAIWYQARRLAAQYEKNAVGSQLAPNAPGATATDGVGSASAPGGGAGPVVKPGAPPGEVPGGPAAAHLKNQPDAVPEKVWKEGKLATGKTLLEVRTAIYNQFQPVWSLFGITIDPTEKPETGMGMVKATLGRRRFRSGGSGDPRKDENQGENDSLANQNDLKRARPNTTKDPSKMGGTTSTWR